MKRKQTFRVTERSLDARKLAIQLMLEHGLDDWAFAFNDSTRFWGLCHRPSHSDVGRIELSIVFCEAAPESEVRDTILHEIAHALCPRGEKHGPLWKAKCLEIGAVPKACCSGLDIPFGNWMATCQVCDAKYYRMRRPLQESNYRCSTCKRQAPVLIWQKRLQVLSHQ